MTGFFKAKALRVAWGLHKEIFLCNTKALLASGFISKFLKDDMNPFANEFVARFT
jgi:hypothetical protein